MSCKIKVFSHTIEQNSSGKELQCYLIGMKLNDYLNNLPSDYQDYDIQRGIVRNNYLDNIGKDIIKGNHLPIITLTTDSSIDKENDLIEGFKILDGLQRTFRIHQLYLFLKKISEEEIKNEIFDVVKSENKNDFRRKYRSEWKLSDEFSYTVLEARNIVETFINYRKELVPNNLLDIFDREQWFEVWENLLIEDEIRKMILLNAGHKPMNNYHQLELLFLNQLSLIKKEFSKIEIVRGKDMSTLAYAKSRKKHQFYFAHIIETILSFLNEDVVTLNSSLIQSIQEGDDASIRIQENPEIISETINFLLEFDDILDSQFGNEGTKWIAKDTVLTAVVVAISRKGISYKDFIELLNKYPNKLNVEGFNDWRKTLDISSINIGKHTKETVILGISDFIENHNLINWKLYSGGLND
ncbi:hypothetical protein B7720_04440 [Streptococcus oralis subsp. oralis]|uniref:hypothetical protein n=1 Tax=Streptococcus TaxID=1301 RepID=UPI0001F89492|nr:MULTISPECIES: hypothetical protein [Streptococcus]EFX55933.1 hypothetical protein HMPREF0849_01834 [Streptococcus sp. C300]MBN6011785.1 hypothetical protein [Streptococcus oralis subsp. oralis]ORO55249.1 hypothetical protein B7720_04440 [Streptococcus oralis subsp. oralis]